MSQASNQAAAAALLQAFEAWRAHQRLAGRLRHGSSEAVYRAMWQALVGWCVAQQPALRLGDLRGPPLAAYLASRTGLLAADGVLTPRYQQRLLSLVRRVQIHQAWAHQQAQATPASRSPSGLRAAFAPPALSTAMPTSPPGPTEAPSHLRPAQAAQLQALLGQALAQGARWQTLRDRCAVALQLGAGLGPGDVRALRLADVMADVMTGVASGPHPAGAALQLRVPANGSAPAHVAPVAGWAAALLVRWQALRTAQALAGPWLFPSTRSGKPWGKVAQYESARRVLADAGLDADGGGSFRLRHSFALRQLQHGRPADTVARWLGVVDPAVMLRYQAVVAGWPAVYLGPADARTLLDWPA